MRIFFKAAFRIGSYLLSGPSMPAASATADWESSRASEGSWSRSPGAPCGAAPACGVEQHWL